MIVAAHSEQEAKETHPKLDHPVWTEAIEMNPRHPWWSKHWVTSPTDVKASLLGFSSKTFLNQTVVMATQLGL